MRTAKTRCRRCRRPVNILTSLPWWGTIVPPERCHACAHLSDDEVRGGSRGKIRTSAVHSQESTMPQIRLVINGRDAACLDITCEEASRAADVLGRAIDVALHGVRVLGRYTREIINTLSTDMACHRMHAFVELQHRLVEYHDDHSAEWRIVGLQS